MPPLRGCDGTIARALGLAGWPGAGSARRPSQRSRSSARAIGRAVAPPGSFSRHFRQIVSRSRSTARPMPAGRVERAVLAPASSVSSTESPWNGGLPGQERIQDRAQAVDVGRRRDPLSAAGLLGRHVGRCAEDRARLGQPESPSTRLARPKSVTCGSSCRRGPAPSKDVAGFKSRCRMPRWWAW